MKHLARHMLYLRSPSNIALEILAARIETSVVVFSIKGKLHEVVIAYGEVIPDKAYGIVVLAKSREEDLDVAVLAVELVDNVLYRLHIEVGLLEVETGTHHHQQVSRVVVLAHL